MTTTSERRRNQRAEACRACGKPCEAGQGYLYRDTDSRTVHRYSRFGWFVKCEACHAGAKTRTTVAMERHAAAYPPAPVERPWSVVQVRKWAVVRTVHQGDVALRVEAGTFFSEVISYRDRISGAFTAPSGYELEQQTIFGKPLSAAAAKDLEGRILPLVAAVNAEERAAALEAVARLVAAGAIVAPTASGYAWRVEFRGGHYTLWGHFDGSNRISGMTRPDEQGHWVETTAEELLRKVEGGTSNV